LDLRKYHPSSHINAQLHVQHDYALCPQFRDLFRDRTEQAQKQPKQRDGGATIQPRGPHGYVLPNTGLPSHRQQQAQLEPVEARCRHLRQLWHRILTQAAQHCGPAPAECDHAASGLPIQGLGMQQHALQVPRRVQEGLAEVQAAHALHYRVE
jgi:hypothetical protein